MTKAGYTHVLIPESLHSVLKEGAKEHNTSIWRYIQSLIELEDNLTGKLVGHQPLGSSNPPLGATNFNSDKSRIALDSINTKDFEKFLIVQKNLSKGTIETHSRCLNVFLKSVDTDIEVDDIQDFMLKIKQTKSAGTYKNYLSLLKILFRDYLGKEDMISNFKFPRQHIKPKILPSKQQLRTFFDNLPSSKYKAIFLLLSSSGLRISELLNSQINTENRIIIPKTHDGETKKAWISFYNEEAGALLNECNPFETSRNTTAHVFKATSDKTGISVSAQTLRSVFAREMSRSGVQDRYIDAFCGRVPASVLARHYSDFSPEVLKEIYDKAGIKILA